MADTTRLTANALRAKWHELSLTARWLDEPLYVTPDEFAELRRMSAAQEREDMLAEARYGPRSTVPYFYGHPVVVDAERATEQRLHRARSTNPGPTDAERERLLASPRRTPYTPKAERVIHPDDNASHDPEESDD